MPGWQDAEIWHHRKMSSLAPGFLVAAPILHDPNFAGTVVLVVEHSPEGALGFVVNRAAGAALREVLAQLGVGELPVRNEIAVMVGGPVSPDGLDRVEGTGAVEQREDVLMVTPSLGVSASKQFLLDAVQGKASGRAMLVQGYAGWGPGQLEAELAQGVWIPVDLDARVIFDTVAEQRWTAALAVLGEPAALPRRRCEAEAGLFSISLSYKPRARERVLSPSGGETAPLGTQRGRILSLRCKTAPPLWRPRSPSPPGGGRSDSRSVGVGRERREAKSGERARAGGDGSARRLLLILCSLFAAPSGCLAAASRSRRGAGALRVSNTMCRRPRA